VHRVKGYVETDQGLYLLQLVGDVLTLEKVNQETAAPSEQGHLVFIYIDQQEDTVRQHLQQNFKQHWRFA